MLKYMRYLFTTALMVVVMTGLALGGSWMWLGLAGLIAVLVGGDMFSGEDLSQPRYGHTWILNAMLYLTLPVLLVMLTLLAWMTGSPDSDFLEIGRFVHTLTGYDLAEARAATHWYHLVGAVFGVGFSVAGFGTNVGHELTHRTSDPAALVVGRWLLAMSGNADFSIEHVYGHHLHVGTDRDPATARRGENVYAFVIRSWVDGHASAWELESRRLRRKGQRVLSFHNLILRGYAMTFAYAFAFFAAGGITGYIVFFAQAAWAKCVLEIVNYFEHYGLIRVPGERVAPRHSWNTNKVISSRVLFSLTRHSAHHEKGDLPFWVLKPYPEAPTMPYGYLTTIFISLVPPVWHRLMRPLLASWDASDATAAEKLWAQEQNVKAGWDFSASQDAA